MTAKRAGSHPLLLLTFGAVCISFAAIFVKWVDMDKLGPTSIAFWRTFFGSGFLFLIALFMRCSLKISVTALGYSAVAGLLFFLDLFLWHRSIIYVGAGMSTILANTQVFATAVLSFLIFKERLTTKFIVSAFSAMVGVVLLVGLAADQVQFTVLYTRGIIYGLATGIIYASYIITLKKAGQSTRLPDIVVFLGWTSLFSALFLGAATAIEGARFLPPDLHSLSLLLLLALIAQALGWLAIFTSLKQVTASRAGLVLLLQPTLATVWGALFFAEELATTQLLGAAITLAAIYFGSTRRTHKQERQHKPDGFK